MFKKILPKSKIVFQASITDVSNCNQAIIFDSEENCKTYMKVSNRMTLEALKKLASTKPNSAKIVLLPRPPRIDNLSELSDFANIDLRVQYCKLSPQIRRKVILVNHTIKIGDEENQSALFGAGGDGVHYRGAMGPEEYTQSVFRAITQADNAMFPNQTKPNQAPVRNQIPVYNRFNIFNQLN